jgi:hypothetical protein
VIPRIFTDLVTIETPLGNIVGRKEGDVVSFLGIPYAEPPIDSNRCVQYCLDIFVLSSHPTNLFILIDFGPQSLKAHGHLQHFMLQITQPNAYKVLCIPLTAKRNVTKIAYTSIFGILQIPNSFHYLCSSGFMAEHLYKVHLVDRR